MLPRSCPDLFKTTRKPGGSRSLGAGGVSVVNPLRELHLALSCPLGFDRGYNDAALLAFEAASTQATVASIFSIPQALKPNLNPDAKLIESIQPVYK